jgi:hypothetical protein
METSATTRLSAPTQWSLDGNVQTTWLACKSIPSSTIHLGSLRARCPNCLDGTNDSKFLDSKKTLRPAAQYPVLNRRPAPPPASRPDRPVFDTRSLHRIVLQYRPAHVLITPKTFTKHFEDFSDTKVLQNDVFDTKLSKTFFCSCLPLNATNSLQTLRLMCIWSCRQVH